jgi:hypothetical protein
VASDRAALAEALRDGPAARVADARDRQRHLLCHAGGLPVAPAAERLAAYWISWKTAGSAATLPLGTTCAFRENGPTRTLMAHLGKDTYSHIHYDSAQGRVISVREAARCSRFLMALCSAEQ